MATPGEHLREADANAQRAAGFEQAGDPWEIVLLFYSALHLVEACLATKAQRFQASDHVGLDKAIQASPELRHIRAPYRALRDLSQQVRYDPAFVAAEADRQAARKHRALVDSATRGKVQRWLIANPSLANP